MHITEYFVILYSELQEIMNKFKVAYLHHQSMLNLADNTVKQAGNEVSNDTDIEASKEAAIEAVKDAAIEAGKDAAIEAGKDAAKETSKETSK
jgi:hypothetical protein